MGVKKDLANIITGIRILLSPVFLFIKPFTLPFYILYVVCGISDMADGIIARKTHTESEFGSKLDSIADFLFIMIMLVRILPVIEIKPWLWCVIALIAVVKMINYISGYVCYKKIVMPHTIANKLTGFLLFVLTPFIEAIGIHYIAIPICVVALFAAIQEEYLIRTKQIDKEDICH